MSEDYYEVRYWPTDTASIGGTYLDPDGKPIDVTGWTGVFRWYAGETMLGERTDMTVNGPAGEFRFDFTTSEVADWVTDGATDYTLTISGGGQTKTLLAGPLVQRKRWGQ